METTTEKSSGDGLAQGTGRSKLLLIGAAVVSCFVFCWVGGRLGLSRARGFDGSLLLAPSAFGNLIVTIVMIFTAIVLGTLIAGTVRPDAGLFAAAAGLTALSFAGRPVSAVLHDLAGARGTYLSLAFELVLLYAALGIGWYMLSLLRRRGHLQGDAVRDGLADVELPANAGWSAFVCHVLTMAVVVLLLAQSDEKKQVLAAVGIGSFIGAFFPYWQHGARPSIWYWTAPLVVGLIGYGFAYISPAPGLEIGRPGIGGGILGPLSRPLPLDYAGVGTAGALIGYWMRRNSLRDREALAAASNTPRAELASA